ncbi:disease resistance protein Pik-2-like [Miscanthus floridulus]|uniref:disease resistance protein Pik-2-like n=1 Tax=Miscanthus floridulus TaxID=154761 RepID=UPI003457B8A2
MAEMISSAATGVLGSVIDKLADMLTDKYNLARDVKQGIRSLQDELRTMEAMLLRLEDKDDDQIDPLAKDWRSKVRELSYDIEDCVDRFVLNHSHGGSKANFVRKAMQEVKTLFEDGGIAEEIRELKRLVSKQSERGKRYCDINQCLLASSSQPVLLDPRAPALFQEAMDLVGIDAPREEIISLLRCEDKEHKVVSIYGIGGQGKTTLAMEVYHKITEAAFDSRAFVSVSQTPDMKKLLRDILSQISKSYFDQSQMLETVEQLIRTVKECLKDKRYFVLIDDIWNVDAWELVRSALPRNDKGSRIITTTRIEAVAKSCCTGIAAQMYFVLIDDIWNVDAWELVRSALPRNDNGSRIITTTRIEAVAKSCCAGIAAQMYQAKPLSHEDSQRLFFKRLFLSGDDCHPDLRKVSNDILKKCCGLPLAIISIAGLLANRSKAVEVWVNVLRSIAAAVDKDSPIDKMKRILLLSYVDLPYHLKSCLLYLSVFPEDYPIDCRQMISVFGCSSSSMFQLILSHRTLLNHPKFTVQPISRTRPILLWVAEGLIPGQDRQSMEQLGRSYLNELINRSLVQPTKVGGHGAIVKQCRVHDVILEFIVSKAVEDNFVTIWNVYQGLSDLINLRILEIDWPFLRKDHKEACISMLSKLFTRLRELHVWFKWEGGLVLGLQNLAGLKHVDVDVDCSAAVADEVEALENDIRDAAGVHPNSTMLQDTRMTTQYLHLKCAILPTLVVALLMLHQATSRGGDGMDDTEKIKEPNQSIRMEQKIQGFMPVEFCQRWSSPATGRWIQSSR